MKKFEIIMTVTVPNDINEELLTGSIVDDAIRSYVKIVEIEYECKPKVPE